MRRVHMLCVSWLAAMGLLSGCAAMAADPPLPPPVSVGPVEVKAVRWLAEGYNPAWGPNGSFFIVSRWKGGFFRYPADGSKETRLGKNSEGFCDLSPDGKSVLYCQTRPTKGGHGRDAYGIGVMKADGTSRRMVNKTAAYAKWSPDGRYFLCQPESQRYVQEGPVFIYDRAGKLARRLDYATGRASWSGDGQYLAYVGKAGKIYLARGDGSSSKVADQPTGGEPYADLWWSPKGHNLLYAWSKRRYGAHTSPLCHFAPGRTPIEICDAFRTVIWSPSGDRVVAISRPRRLTVFAFPKGKDPEVLLTREPGGDDYPTVLWHDDGRSLFYMAPDGLWLASAESEEDRSLGRPSKLLPRAALSGGILVCTEGESSSPSLLDPQREESSPLTSDPELQLFETPSTCGRALIAPVWSKAMGSKLLLFQITRRT